MRQYGLPYKGSKSGIAVWVIDHLPPGGTLVDLFCGGCAVTHAALESNKWTHVFANDIHGDVPQLFLDAVCGKYTVHTERRWISRDDFYRLKDTDAYVRLCWSFGNNGDTYMYGREIEPFKKRVHDLIFAETVRERQLAWHAFVREFDRLNQDVAELSVKTRAFCAECGAEVQRLQSLQRLQISGCDYRNVAIPADAVVYCDIPYDCTSDNYGVSFDRAAFLDWADAQTMPVIVSEYNISDDRFAVLAEIQKRQLMQGAKAQKRVMERLYVPKRQLDMIKERLQMQEKMSI